MMTGFGSWLLGTIGVPGMPLVWGDGAVAVAIGLALPLLGALIALATERDTGRLEQRPETAPAPLHETDTRLDHAA